MPILSGDIKLVASQVMDDVPEGGGAPTATVIVDGLSNAIFPDVSEMDRAGGRVNLRKLHVSVQTADRDTYMGSNVIVSEPPADPNISITLFTTRSAFDRRTDAASMIESYLIRASPWGGFLLENHVAGQRVIQIFQRPEMAEPTIGRTLVLVLNEGLNTEVVQYVRIIRVDSTIRTFTNSTGAPYQAKVCTCDISDALRSNFAGSPATWNFTVTAGKTLLRDTSVADAGAYFGVAPLRLAAAIGESQVSATSIYTRLVPSAATETVAIDIKPSAQRSLPLAASPRAVSVGVSPHTMRIKLGQENRAFSYVQILSPLPEPGTLEVSYLAQGEWYRLEDDGIGGFTGTGTGTVNYVSGSVSVTLPVLPDIASSLIFSWGEKLGFTNMSGTATFRPPEFSFDLTHKGIDPGSLTVTWLSGGVLKTATAALDGTLSGHAAGYVAHTTGQLTLRPTAMLDAGGQFSISYTYTDVIMETKTGLSASVGGLVTFSTAEVPVAGSVMVEWFTAQSVSDTSGSKLGVGSSTKSSSSSSSNQSTEMIDSKTVQVLTGSFHNGTSNPSFRTWNTYRDEVVTTPRLATSTVTHDTTGGTSSKLTNTSSQTSNKVITVYNTITENGAGGFLNALGVINYAGKTVTLKVVDQSRTNESYANDTESASDFGDTQSRGSNDPGSAAGTYAVYQPANGNSLSGGEGGGESRQGGTFGNSAISEAFDGSALFVTYRTGASSATAHTETYTPGVVQVDLAPYTTNRIVPGSVQFTWMGHTYQDIEGRLYRDPVTGSAGFPAGAMDYTTGIAHITDYVVGPNPADMSLTSLWVSKGDWSTSKVFCRTPSAPVKPGGFVFSILDVAGTQIIATADNYGAITGDHCLGQIDYQTGVVDMIFGDLVLDSTLTAEAKAEWWYAKALTQITAAGKVWRPWPIDPNSLRFNAVSYFYLPLDANLLGIDPVRLPQDGKVPIFRPGGFAVVGHTGKIVATAVVSTAATGTLTIAAPTADDTFTVASVAYILKAAPVDLQNPVQVGIGIDDGATATNIAAAVTSKSGTTISASAAGSTVTFTALGTGLAGNTYTLAGGPRITTSGTTFAGGTGIYCGRQRLSRVRVIGQNAVVINTGYTADLEAGTVAFTNVTGYSQPVTIEHRVEDMAVVREAQIGGAISFTRALTHAYPANTSYISSALVAGDLKSRVSVLFDQTTWGNVWQDSVIGTNANGTFNDIAHPITVTNAGALTERWAVVFVTSDTVYIMGEHVGVIFGSISNAKSITATWGSPIDANGAPISGIAIDNPATGTPYFSIPSLGWGAGWAAGNVLRFNTVGAMNPVWVVRTVQQGPNTGVEHSFTLLSRGDVDRP